MLSAHVLLTALFAICVSGVFAANLPRTRSKRQAEILLTQTQAEIALTHHTPGGCPDQGCGLFDPDYRGKRKRSEQPDSPTSDLVSLMRLNAVDQSMDDSPQPWLDSAPSDDLKYSRRLLLERILHDLLNK